MWIIVTVNSDGEKLFWSNSEGWQESPGDTFSDAEQKAFSLPLGGVWERI